MSEKTRAIVERVPNGGFAVWIGWHHKPVHAAYGVGDVEAMLNQVLDIIGIEGVALFEPSWPTEEELDAEMDEALEQYEHDLDEEYGLTQES